MSLLGLMRHLTEMERAYAVWALGPKSELQWVWGDYTDGGPEWDIDADAAMVSDSIGAGNAADCAGTSPSSPANTPVTTAMPT